MKTAIRTALLKVIKMSANRLGHRLEPDIPGLPSDTQRRMRLLDHYGINCVLDIGANIGQFAKDLRNNGYKGRIISFEPLSECFKTLQDAAANDAFWHAYNYAIGDKDMNAPINVSKNQVSSSLAQMKSLHSEAAPDSAFVGEEIITVHKLDTVYPNLPISQKDNVYVKLDTQGYEKKAIEGARHSLTKCTGIQLELSIQPLYEACPLYCEMINIVENLGFSLHSLEPSFCDSTGRILQFDGIFYTDG